MFSHESNGLYLLKLISTCISLSWINTGHAMCSWTCLGPILTSQTPRYRPVGLLASVFTTEHGTFRQVFVFSHESNGLYLLKLVSISLLWINKGNTMCSWTSLGPILSSQKPWSQPAISLDLESFVIRNKFNPRKKRLLWPWSVPLYCLDAAKQKIGVMTDSLSILRLKF